MIRITTTTAPVALYGRDGTRAIEARATAALPAQALMQRAGAAVARLAVALAPHARRVWIAAGPGNNGGDGLEAAIRLRRDGRDAGVLLVGDPARRPPDAAAALARAHRAGVPLDASEVGLDARDLVIDALLGIGASRAPDSAIADAIRRIDGSPATVLAIDVPSGLDVDSGQPFGRPAVVAQHTLALLTLKPGLFTAAGRDHAGSVWLDTLGVEAANEPAPDAWLRGDDGDTPFRAARPHATHKGSYGDVAIVGGASGMAGAGVLAARAAHAGGAGRVHVALLQGPRHGPALDLDPLRPELMFRADWCEASPPEVVAATTIVCGCGGGDAVLGPLPRLLNVASRLVLDADALNAIAADRSLRAVLRTRIARGLQSVLTPHPLEASRLLDCTTAEVQADRLGAAHGLADRYGSIVVLKGSGSVIAAPGRVPVINATGSAALASAGTGDVLAGWLGGLWAEASRFAQAPQPFAVTVRAVAEHGAVADDSRFGPLRAGDLVERLHRRLREGRPPEAGAARRGRAA